MEIIKRNKTSQITAFTESCNKLESVLLDENDEPDEIEVCFCLFSKKLTF